MSSAALGKELEDFLEQAGIDDPQLQRIQAGRNSRVWRIDSAGKSYVLKEYFRHSGDLRDRCATEYGFLTFLQSLGITHVPQPLASQLNGDRALYSYLPGSSVVTIQPEHIAQAAEFIVQINWCADKASARQLPPASEACFSISEHLNRVKSRLGWLQKAVAGKNDWPQVSVQQFLAHHLWPTYQHLEQHLRATSPNLDCSLGKDQCILSPSDFGFHNILESGEQLYFLDFEYAGWDDPAKLICDFACQPEHPVSRSQGRLFAIYLDQLKAMTQVQDRAHLLLPLYRLKWCCILLNEFRGQDRQRRNYAGIDQADQLQTQLHKAQTYFDQHLRDL